MIGDGVIDYGGCQCPVAWWGICPPPCPVRNPLGGVTYRRSYASNKIELDQAPVPPPMLDADIERIARRVAELMKPKRKVRK